VNVRRGTPRCAPTFISEAAAGNGKERVCSYEVGAHGLALLPLSILVGRINQLPDSLECSSFPRALW
jgi:hypothetical protein